VDTAAPKHDPPGGAYPGQPFPERDRLHGPDREPQDGHHRRRWALLGVSLTSGKCTMLCGSTPHVEVAAGTTATLDCDFQMV